MELVYLYIWSPKVTGAEILELLMKHGIIGQEAKII